MDFPQREVERLLPVGGRDDVVLRQRQEIYQRLNIERLIIRHQNPQGDNCG